MEPIKHGSVGLPPTWWDYNLARTLGYSTGLLGHLQIGEVGHVKKIMRTSAHGVDEKAAHGSLHLSNSGVSSDRD